ncbi:MAG: ABC transporter ATP-binding protein [Lachnospiraceae bacterium]
MILFKEVCKSYTGDTYNIQALDSVTFHIEEGEFVSVMGKSGSGKTTLLNILGFLDKADSGTITFMGEDVSNPSMSALWKNRKKYIGFVFQNFALINHCTVYENVVLPLEALGKGRRECRMRVTETLEKLNIDHLVNKYPGQISGGEKQRVAIARALVDESRLILADEPTGALDSNTANEIMDIFKEINNTGKTVIVVTHDNDIAAQTKRKITLENGRIADDIRLC